MEELVRIGGEGEIGLRLSYWLVLREVDFDIFLLSFKNINNKFIYRQNFLILSDATKSFQV